MSANLIEDVRADIKKYFDSTALLADSEEIHYSPDNKYFFKSNYYQQSDTKRNWTVSKIEIFQTDTEEKIFEFIRNDDSLFHGWLITENTHYLLMSEDIEGKSILDITNRQFYSYSFEEDKFIWCEYYPSPNYKKLAIVGCYWACSSEIVIFDTAIPTHFPYKELYRQDTFQEKIEWIDNTTLKITNNNMESKIVKVE
jgi:hypothetical protein